MANTGKYCFTQSSSGKDIYLFTLCNDKGTEVLITNYGAILMAYKIKDGDGHANDIVLGFENPEDYLQPSYLAQYPYFGASIGRYANRIKNSCFTIDGKEIHVAKNWGEDQLHGGFQGFDKKVWEFVSFDGDCNILKLQYLSADNEEGYPGNFLVTISYELNEENDLIISYTGETDQPTAVNLSHHSYFNLNNGEGNILEHEVKIYADKILEQDSNLAVTGNYIAVDNTKYDFQSFHAVNERTSDGYDQSFITEKTDDKLSLVAEVCSKKSKLKLQVFTTEPMVHFYTGQGIPDITGKNGTKYNAYSGLCLETQKHPNAVNIPKFPNTILRPGEKYHQKTVYKVCPTH